VAEPEKSKNIVPQSHEKSPTPLAVIFSEEEDHHVIRSALLLQKNGKKNQKMTNM